MRHAIQWVNVRAVSLVNFYKMEGVSIRVRSAFMVIQGLASRVLLIAFLATQEDA